MSYILDALRRADAERERGAVPGLHSQPVAGAGPAPAARSAPPWTAAAVGAALVAVGAAGWLLRGHETVPIPTQTAAPAPVPAPASPPLAPAPPPSPRIAAAAPPAAAPTPARRPVASPPPAPAPESTPAPMPAAPPAPPVAVQAFEKLPESVRRQLPPITIGGAIYSDRATSRMLIVGGQLLHEGDAAAPGVMLEQIKPKSAVLRWKDLRYEVSF